MVFALINQSDRYGIGGKLILHAENTVDLARQLSFRVIRLVCEDQISFIGKSDDLTSYVQLMDKIADETVTLDHLVDLDVEINGHLLDCQLAAEGQKGLFGIFLALEYEIDVLEPDAWTADGTDPVTGYSKVAARNLLSSYDDPILFEELLGEINEVLYTEP